MCQYLLRRNTTSALHLQNLILKFAFREILKYIKEVSDFGAKQAVLIAIGGNNLRQSARNRHVESPDNLLEYFDYLMSRVVLRKIQGCHLILTSLIPR